ncbi:SHOCT domain-containing protein [Anaerocolumna chitinilytica]|uniref:SHOCT domain-containing protein n=1 Tax=Anaerocolumna chitinilytica TaxID=1727145 RepID=A0A7I8DPX0_9FIRM|nr:SHOCT domain-containing protein [Anaerocolumna chitinilytica]BCK00333.1 hypothetical protein bsdcttw_33730 [Anaerocolumna chitinilytica]
MNRRIRVKPSKGQSLFGFIIGIIFCFIGFIVVVPTFGAFGLLWTLIAIVITAMNAINFFTDKGVASHEFIIDDVDKSNNFTAEVPKYTYSTPAAPSAKDRLEELQNLYDKNLITFDEFEEKRKKILDEL